jgi:hypothetical protein
LTVCIVSYAGGVAGGSIIVLGGEVHLNKEDLRVEGELTDANALVFYPADSLLGR